MSDPNISHIINQPGGCTQIVYGEHHLFAPTNDIHTALELLRSSTDRVRRMKTVQREINRNLPKLEKGTIMPQEANNLAADITIWFANEIIEGRASLEQKHLALV